MSDDGYPRKVTYPCLKCGSAKTKRHRYYQVGKDQQAKIQVLCRNCGSFSTHNKEDFKEVPITLTAEQVEDAKRAEMPKDDQINLLKNQVRTLHGKIITLENRLADSKIYQQIIIDTIRRETISLPAVAPIYQPEEKVKSKYGTEVAMLNFSDVQIGSLVKSDEVGGLANYNKDVFRERISKLADKIYKVINIQRSGGINVENLRINVLGDIVQGESVFPGQGFKLDALMLEQVFVLADEIIQRLFIPLSRLFKNVDIFCIPGNHGKQGRRGDSSRNTNWDYIVYWLWKMRMAEFKNTEFFISNGPFMIYELFPNQVHALIHGNQAQGWMGFPYYGIDRLYRRITSLTGIFIQYLHHGHHHQPSIQDTHIGKKIGNGSIEGGSDYSINDLLTANVAQQFFCGLNEEGITWEYWLRLAKTPRLKPDGKGLYTKLMKFGGDDHE